MLSSGKGTHSRWAIKCHSLYANSSAVDALQALLLRSGSQDVLHCVELEGGWELLKTSAGHEDGVAQLAR